MLFYILMLCQMAQADICFGNGNNCLEIIIIVFLNKRRKRITQQTNKQVTELQFNAQSPLVDVVDLNKEKNYYEWKQNSNEKCNDNHYFKYKWFIPRVTYFIQATQYKSGYLR